MLIMNSINKIKTRKLISSFSFNELPFGDDINKIIQEFDEKYKRENEKQRIRKDNLLFELSLIGQPRKYCKCLSEKCNIMTYDKYCKQCEYERWC